MYRYSGLMKSALLILIIVPLTSQSQEPAARFGRSPFALSVGQALDDEGGSSLVIDMTIPYRRLVFFKRGDGYEARFRLYVNVRGEKKKQLSGEVWEESVMVADYEQTRSASSVKSVRRVFPAVPGEYGVEVTVEVIDTSLKYTDRRTISILGRESGRFRLADPVFFTPAAGTEFRRPSGGEIVVTPCTETEVSDFKPNSDAVYADVGVWPHVVFNLLSPTETIENYAYTVSVRMEDMRGNLALYNRAYLRTSESGYQRLCMDVSVDDLMIGDYEISVAVEVPGTNQRAVSKGRFTVLLNRGSLGGYFRETMKILSLYADEDELEELAGSTPENRVQAWNRFWLRRDPNPSSKVNEDLGEFLRRLEHILRSFSGFRPGWQTDRGKIYLRYGQPDDIVDRQGRIFGTTYQLWYYYSRGVVYIFEDMLGTGDFRLLDTRMI
jgi:GWxTD domain-containing protein